MDDLITAATSADEGHRSATVAVLPIGSFEQHSTFLPLVTDTIVACTIAKRISDDHNLFLLPPVALSCSHEHSAFPGTVSISPTTLATIIGDIAQSLERGGIRRLVLVSGHGGNYVLSNVVQEANETEARMVLFPGRADWDAARAVGNLATSTSEDMHAGELEVSILLAVRPDLVGEDHRNPSSDVNVIARPHLLTVGMRGYTGTGVIGRPSLGTADKGRAVIDGLAHAFKPYAELLSP